jgi:hypothetical protein
MYPHRCRPADKLRLLLLAQLTGNLRADDRRELSQLAKLDDNLKEVCPIQAVKLHMRCIDQCAAIVGCVTVFIQDPTTRDRGSPVREAQGKQEEPRQEAPRRCALRTLALPTHAQDHHQGLCRRHAATRSLSLSQGCSSTLYVFDLNGHYRC